MIYKFIDYPKPNSFFSFLKQRKNNFTKVLNKI